jgi:predicted ATPase
MIYKKFLIKNFQGISELEIDLSNNRIVTLVGLNESGKTTILQAIYWFYKMIRGIEPDAGQLNKFRPKGFEFTGAIVIEGELVFEDSDYEKIRKKWKTLDDQNKLIIPKSYSYQYIFNYELHAYKGTSRTCTFLARKEGSDKDLHDENNARWQELVKFVKLEVVPEILFYEDFIFEIPESIQFVINQTPQQAKANPKNESWQLVLDDILKAINPNLSFQDHIVNLWVSDNDTAENRISQIEGELNKKITNSWKALFQKESKKLNFKEINLKCDFQNNTLTVSFQIKTDANKIFSINERSKGCKWFFSFLLFTEFRKNRTKNILFLLDEPASNLHSSAQTKILEAIEELSDKSLVIYSTHSHHLINVRWLPGAYIVINEMLSEDSLRGDVSFTETAKIQAVKYFKYVGSGAASDNVSYFQPILDALDFKPSSVEHVPNIAILEGKNDWYTITYFSEIIFKEKKPLNLYPGGGKDKLWEIIRIYLSWGESFVVLLDGDKGGQDAKDAYIEEFEEMVNERIFTLKDVGLNGELEDQIEEIDQKIIYETIYGPDSYLECKANPSNFKKNLNGSIIQLLIKKTPVQISDNTKENFKKILNFIRLELKSQNS